MKLDFFNFICQREANCMRRCEELPWHLQLCRKWYALKDTLTDLKTFELMYGSDLKDELMAYWITLTEGPLFVTDEAQKLAASIAQARTITGPGRGRPPPTLLQGDHAEKTRLLSELDAAAALGLSEKEARKQLLKDKIAPFDVVEEFNRSIENWLYVSHPTASQMKQIVSQIAKFLADFSHLVKNPPSFLRLGVDLKGLSSFGINFEDTKNLTATGTEEDRALTSNIVGDSHEFQSFPTPQQVSVSISRIQSELIVPFSSQATCIRTYDGFGFNLLGLHCQRQVIWGKRFLLFGTVVMLFL